MFRVLNSLASLLLLACITSIASAQESKVEIVLADGFVLQGEYPAIQISGPSGISMIGMFNDRLGKEITDMEGLKEKLKDFGQGMIAGSVEKEAKFTELKSDNGMAAYYVLTDPEFANVEEIPQGKFRYLTNGMINLGGEIPFTFSILHNDLKDNDFIGLLDIVANGFKIPTRKEDLTMKDEKAPAGDEEKNQTEDASSASNPVERTLTDTLGRTIKATILSADDNNITIKRDDKIYTVPIEKLCDKDKAFISEWRTLTR